jgi:hypothetical protein
MTQVRDQRGVPLRTFPRAHPTSPASGESRPGAIAAGSRRTDEG